MKAKEIMVGMHIKATPWMQDPIQGVVKKIERHGSSGGCVITFHLEGYKEAFSFRGSASIKVIKPKAIAASEVKE